MPRRSIEAITTTAAAPRATGTPLVPDRDLPDAVREVFAATVSACGAGHFRESDRIALEQLAFCVTRCRRAELALAAEGEVIDGAPSPWIGVLKDTRRDLVGLLVKLRLVPSARMQAKSVPGAVDAPSLHAALALVRQPRR
jgi:hypothetical protein